MATNTIVLAGAMRVDFDTILKAAEEAVDTLPAGVLTEWNALRLSACADTIRQRHRQELPHGKLDGGAR